MTGFLLGIILPVLYTLPSELIWLIPISMLNGVLQVISMTIAYAYVADIIPENARGKYFGQYNMVRSISFGVIPIITAGTLPDIWGRNLLNMGYSSLQAKVTAMIWAFYLASIISLIGLVMFIIHRGIAREIVKK